MEGQVDAAGDRDLAAEETLRRGRVVVEAVADVACLPAGVADRVAGVEDLQPGELLEVLVDDAAKARNRRARSPGATSRQAGNASCALPMAASASSRDAEAGEESSSTPVVGLISVAHAQSLSNPRVSSQSVTAAL